MFAEARKSDMDLDALGEQLAMRKSELEDAGDDGDEPPIPRGQKSRAQPGRMAKSR